MSGSKSGKVHLNFPGIHHHDDEPQGAAPPVHVQDVRLQGGRAADFGEAAAEVPVQGQTEGQGGPQGWGYSVELQNEETLYLFLFVTLVVT